MDNVSRIIRMNTMKSFVLKTVIDNQRSGQTDGVWVRQLPRNLLPTRKEAILGRSAAAEVSIVWRQSIFVWEGTMAP